MCEAARKPFGRRYSDCVGASFVIFSVRSSVAASFAVLVRFRDARGLGCNKISELRFFPSRIAKDQSPQNYSLGLRVWAFMAPKHPETLKPE